MNAIHARASRMIAGWLITQRLAPMMSGANRHQLAQLLNTIYGDDEDEPQTNNGLDSMPGEREGLLPGRNGY